MKVIKPALTFPGSISGIRSLQKVSSALKLSGFVNVTDAKLLKTGDQLDVCFKEGLRKLGWSLTNEELETITLVQVCVCVCVSVCLYC